MLARLSGSFDENRQLKVALDLREAGNLRIPTTPGSMVRNVGIPLGKRRGSEVVLRGMDEVDPKLGAVLIKLVVITKCTDSGYARKLQCWLVRSAAIEEATATFSSNGKRNSRTGVAESIGRPVSQVTLANPFGEVKRVGVKGKMDSGSVCDQRLTEK